MSLQDIEVQVQQATQKLETVAHELNKVIVGQTAISQKLIIALLSGGHVLLEGLPGLAKTTLIKTLGEALTLKFKRIQFTPDLLPADLIGTQIYNPQEGNFTVRQGPVFSHLVLADEINRAPAKVQSALLEAMAEKQVTIGDTTWPLEEPFLVMATQNPIEQEGTYPLPEAQMDRFMFKLLIDYPSPKEEQEILRRAEVSEQIKISPVLHGRDILEMRDLVSRIHVSDKIRQYIVDIVFATRLPKNYGLTALAGLIETGASPRASLAMDRAARSLALMSSRSYVVPQDVKDIAHDVLRHRIRPSFEAEAESVTTDQMVSQILEKVDVP